MNAFKSCGIGENLPRLGSETMPGEDIVLWSFCGRVCNQNRGVHTRSQAGIACGRQVLGDPVARQNRPNEVTTGSMGR